MAVRNLRLYDILVDLIPGTMAVGIIFLSTNPKKISAGAGLTLLLAGYVAGRILHAVGSVGPVVKIRKQIEGCIIGGYVDDLKHGLSFRNRVREQYGASTLSKERDHQSEVPEDILEQVIEGLGDKFFPSDDDDRQDDGSEDEFDIETPILSHDQLKEQSDNITDDVLALRYYGENYLYGRNTLYRKYEMISTFYRSLTLVSVFSIPYLIILHIQCLPGSLPLGTVHLVAVLGTLLLVSFLSLRQRLKYRAKKTRAFINDLHIELQQDE